MGKVRQIYVPDEYLDLIEQIKLIEGESVSSFLLKTAKDRLDGGTDLPVDIEAMLDEKLAPVLGMLQRIVDGRLTLAPGTEPVTDKDKEELLKINSFFSNATGSMKDG